jgi:hypothetical protein
MNKTQLPQRAFNSPCIEYANFEDGSFVNLIKLVTPYANGKQYAVYHTSTGEVIGGLYKTYEQATEQFLKAVKMNQKHSKMTTTSQWIVTPHFGLTLEQPKEEAKPTVNERTLKLTEDEVQMIVNILNHHVSKTIHKAEREFYETSRVALFQKANLLNELADDIEQGKRDV